MNSVNSLIPLIPVQTNYSPAGYMAGGILSLIGAGFVTWPSPIIDTATLNSPFEGGGDRKSSPIENINNSSTPSFAVYPNPTTGALSLISGEGTFMVYNLFGQKLQDYQVTKGQTELQLPSNISSGIYIGKFKPFLSGPTQQVSIMYQAQ
jgi:hypothetical protein